jgi:hypothetical protein
MEQRIRRFVGVDLAKKSMEVCVLQEGKLAERASYRTDAVGRRRLASSLRKSDTVAMEACSLAFVLARQLKREVGCRVHVLNPGKLAVIWQSTRKTDREDANKLALLIQRYPEDELPSWSFPASARRRCAPSFR